MTIATITRNGSRFALVPWADYQRMTRREQAVASPTRPSLPPLPPVSADGTGNAIDFARASIGRTLIRRRQAAGLSQQALARRAGVRQETISRIESGKHTVTVRVIDKIDKALNRAESGGKTLHR
jgi:ribosome-binding protein aMBF1 (putative translation factor)